MKTLYMNPEIATTTEPTAALPEVLDVSQLAQLLRVRPNSIYYMIEHKQIPCRRTGKSYRFNRETIMNWLSGNKDKAA
ncbi:MAG: hypothetical protein CVU65_00160 [Deltaproteobacteria bacterium HGW-Deltaproteobacteria-22]|jgi:excisionase family DNA binding protein|nr:MAG: hypothetical protein CVU65_00160 [Deltaproteobacteria bacterium HGW-Deltaproteobacteria-22]